MIRATLWVLIVLAAAGAISLHGHLPASQAADRWVAAFVSTQGQVTAQAIPPARPPATETPVYINDPYPFGKTVQTNENSRTTIVLVDTGADAAAPVPDPTRSLSHAGASIIRLDQNTRIVMTRAESDDGILVEVLEGAAHFFSRIRRHFRIKTEYVNAGVEGTEFLVRVDRASEQTIVTVLNGRVLAHNDQGRLSLRSGESAIARRGEAPRPYQLIHPRDAVQWALYYPPIVDWRPTDFDDLDRTAWRERLNRSISAYWRGDMAEAFSAIDDLPEAVADSRVRLYRAALRLSVGRVDAARRDIDAVLARTAPRESGGHQPSPAPGLDTAGTRIALNGVVVEDLARFMPTGSLRSIAMALDAVIAVVQNEKETALDHAREATRADPTSPTAWIALSYAQQAAFQLDLAEASIERAVDLDPENALAHARLAEVQLAQGRLDPSDTTARRAVDLNPDLARTQTIMGFSELTRFHIDRAKAAFQAAIQRDQADPLPRLGLGLALIRDDLPAGRRQMEIAASLDPNNALIRSYLGKAYYEEKRDRLAANQYQIAKDLDPRDPTPWLYDAIRLHAQNRPVEALHSLQESIALNDNRAVYRSRLQLDEDQAVRGVNLARIYDELGFEQLALLEGAKSLQHDPTSHSAHRFLADAYAALPRHEIARVSELLQAQLLQPIQHHPVQPHLAESKLTAFTGALPDMPALNEYASLFVRNGVHLMGSGVVGGNNTQAEEIVVSGVEGPLAFSVGQFHYETDGFRPNNDQRQDIYNVFVQGGNHRTSVQAEYRYRQDKRGDLPLRFDPEYYYPTWRERDVIQLVRVGGHHATSPRSHFLGQIAVQRADFNEASKLFQYSKGWDQDGYLAELQHRYQHQRLGVIYGISHFGSRIQSVGADSPEDISHQILYGYLNIRYPETVTWTVGSSLDIYDADHYLNRKQWNPKAGVIWQPLPKTTIRASAVRAFKRPLISNQTVEPTQVAGFNQFFDDMEATDSKRYGVGIDQRLPQNLSVGVEVSDRDLDVPVQASTLKISDWDEREARGYLMWHANRQLAAILECRYERIERDEGSPDLFTEVETLRFPLSIHLFHPSGVRARVKGTYVQQNGQFGVEGYDLTPGKDRFATLDAKIGYQLPRRLGRISIEARNILDEDFQFQDTDLGQMDIYPERVVIAKIAVAF